MLLFILSLCAVSVMGQFLDDDHPMRPSDIPLPPDPDTMPHEPEPDTAQVYAELVQFMDASMADPVKITPQQAESLEQSELYQQLDQMYGKRRRNKIK
jgi:hypothetical protein